MRARAFSEWPEGWGIVFVVWASGGSFYGKVRLNKYLSILQREGFPILNLFVNQKWGPYDETIDAQANKLRLYDIIDVSEEPSGKERDVTVYRITEHGDEFIKSSIIPLLDNLPHSEDFCRTFLDTARRFRHARTKRIVENVHKELLLDNFVEFVSRLEDTKTELEHKFLRFQEHFADSCPGCLDLLGSLEFTIEALNHILRYGLKDGLKGGRTGKNHVLFNARVLSSLASKFEGHEHFHLLTPEMRNEDPNFKILKRIAHRLHCVEFNSDLYHILKPIDSEEYDFAEFLSPLGPSLME